jgi:hypothetical protein
MKPGEREALKEDEKSSRRTKPKGGCEVQKEDAKSKKEDAKSRKRSRSSRGGQEMTKKYRRRMRKCHVCIAEW